MTKTAAAHFAAYDDSSIYAVGATVEEALKAARLEVNTDDKPSAFRTAPIRAGLASKIDSDGWNGSTGRFEINNDGYLVDLRASEYGEKLFVWRDEDIEQGQGDWGTPHAIIYAPNFADAMDAFDSEFGSNDYRAHGASGLDDAVEQMLISDGTIRTING